MSKVRVLKAADVGQNAIVSVPATRAKSDPTPHEGPAIFTAAEVERLCEEARSVGAAEAAVALEAPLQKIAEGLETVSAQDADVLSSARRADADAIAAAVIDVARWVLGRELRDEQVVLSLIDRAICGSATEQISKVSVHPDLAGVLAEIAPRDLKISGDSAIPSGEFVIETDGPDISLRIDSALAAARDELLLDEIA